MFVKKLGTKQYCKREEQNLIDEEANMSDDYRPYVEEVEDDKTSGTKGEESISEDRNSIESVVQQPTVEEAFKNVQSVKGQKKMKRQRRLVKNKVCVFVCIPVCMYILCVYMYVM